MICKIIDIRRAGGYISITVQIEQTNEQIDILAPMLILNKDDTYIRDYVRRIISRFKKAKVEQVI